MGLFDYFRRKPRVRTASDLADFIDGNSAFLAQKALYEYSRARSGHYSKVLFAEPEFQKAVEHSRWRAFPLGLAMVAEAVDSVLRSQPEAERQRDSDALVAVVLSVFDRYSVPETLGEEAWRELRADLERRLRSIGLHPPKRAMDIPATYAQSYFELMPIHEKLRGRDFPTTHNYLMVSLCNIHDELTRRIEGRPLAEMAGVP